MPRVMEPQILMKAQPAKESEPLTSEEWDNILGNDWRPAQRDQIGVGDDEFPSYEQTLTKPTSLEEHLEWQLAPIIFGRYGPRYRAVDYWELR